MTFTKAERKKISAVLEAQRRRLDTGMSAAGYNNCDGGCPNCGDTGGFDTLLYQLELAFGLR